MVEEPVPPKFALPAMLTLSSGLIRNRFLPRFFLFCVARLVSNSKVCMSSGPAAAAFGGAGGGGGGLGALGRLHIFFFVLVIVELSKFFDNHLLPL